jgi:heme a synthase
MLTPFLLCTYVNVSSWANIGNQFSPDGQHTLTHPQYFAMIFPVYCIETYHAYHKVLNKQEYTSVNRYFLVRIFAIITAIGAFIMMFMGVVVTDTGSGHGCGRSWPFCNGQIIPGTLTIEGLIEYSHRIMSSIDGTLVLVLTVAVWLMYRRDFRAKLLAALSLFFVVLQGALGALTVVFEGSLAENWLLSVHFGLSLVALASVVLLAVRLFQVQRESADAYRKPTTDARKLRFPVWGLAAFTYVVVYTGALVDHTGAVLACGNQIPTCGSTYVPSLGSLAGIQMLHRYAAGSLWLLTLALFIVVLRSYRLRSDITRGAWWSMTLITLQALSGITIVLTGGQLLADLAHITIISTYFCVLSYLCLQVGWPWQKKQQQIQQPMPASESLELNTIS